MEQDSQKVLPVRIEDEMKKSYIDYAMSVIVMRALPDVRDGLKPVHRRILYSMHEAGMASNKPYKKSARIVGEVLGKYHPHGDSSVYDATVRLAQDFSTRYLLVDGHGNFGSVDGDSAAAMRYTEVRMSRLAEEILVDIEKETVDFMPNYDESLKEPVVLPSRVPTLLINGSAGIAVGMATNIPPHNLSEIIDALVLMIDEPATGARDLLGIVAGPDFPTGASIMGREGIKSAYLTGRGVVKIRACAHTESMSGGKTRIIVSQIPYQVNKSRLIESIAELAQNKTIDGITDLRDETDRKGMRIVIELRRDVNPEVILNQLYKHTKMQDSFGINMLALVDGHPRVLNLCEMLSYYLSHRKEVVTRRTAYELKKATEREHILLGLKIALDHLDEVIAAIRASENAETAREALTAKFPLSVRQAQAILEMRLQRLTGLERQKIEDEHAEIINAIERLKSILAEESKLMGIIKDEFLEIKRKYGDKRRTQISVDTSDLAIEDLIAEEDIVMTLTHSGYVKRLPVDTYRSQRRGGHGLKGVNKKEEDFVEHLCITTTHHNVLFFTSRGRVYRLKGYEIPEAGRTAKGSAIVNVVALDEGEKITAIIAVKEFEQGRYIFMATNRGTVKKTELLEFDTARKVGLIAISLDEEEDLIGVELTDGNSNVMLVTKNGLSINFPETDVRSMGRTAHGVHGIKLNKADMVVAMTLPSDDSDILTVTEEGLGKRTMASEYRAQGRGGKGIINIKVTARTGAVVGARVVKPEQELLLITAQGIIIRLAVNDVSRYNRNAQGVRLMRLAEEDKIVAFAAVEMDGQIEP
ncbi:MAG: DNA gyrase subunit A [Acidaminococcales bacterium]|nr:DNA gyrase subunit A [Acidaminococcales bacterium]